jgi:hypothetical protein
MKTYFYIIFILISSLNILIADEIYLKNSKIIKGEVLQITVKNVEYREYNGLPFLIVPIDQVEKIVYSNELKKENQLITDNKPIDTEIKESIYTNRYLDSYLKLFLIGGISFVNGDITDKEDKILEANKSYFYSDDGSYSMDYYSFSRGFELTGLLPALTHKTQISGLKGLNLGLKTRYTFTTLDERATSSEPFEKKYSGILLKYYTISAGPEINFVLGRKTSILDFILQIYSLAGYIPYGRLNAAPCIDGVQDKTRFTGYSFTIGTGLYWSINSELPIILGLSFFSSRTEIKFKSAVSVYDGAKYSSFNEKGFLISIGTHFWNVN